MKPSVFITGAGGFAGRTLLQKLDFSKYRTVYCLSRKMENVRLPASAAGDPDVKIIEGDLLDPPSYQQVLEEVDTVIHMAAATGKVNPKTYFKVNAYGTMLLLDRCKQAGVKHFLFVSTIAAGFKNKYRYFYAQSKQQAEEYVKSSGLKYTILRPTMIMGKGSAVFDGLSMLSGLPVITVFGSGETEIQPVDVIDVARAIMRIDSEARYKGEILELGGPQPVSIEDFMKKIAEARGKAKPRVIHLPISLFIFFLSILERLVYGLLPMTCGQLATFRNDGATAANSLMKKMNSLMLGLDEMIAGSLEKDEPPEMPEPLAQECRVFCKYLTGQKANAYVLEKYYLCHQTLDFTPADFHDKLLLGLAKRGFFFTRMADAYSRFFRSNSTLRKKLAYLVAILEVSPPYFRFYDTADRSGKLGLLIKTGLKGTTLALHLFFSALFLLPLQVLGKLTGSNKTAGAREK